MSISKIVSLTPLLAPALKKAGYAGFSLDKPEMGRDIFIDFSCLDTKSGRDDYDSRNTLKNLADKAIIDINWRLMSGGIHYRLVYLSGRLRAYEREEDIKAPVMKSKKLKSRQRSRDAADKGTEKVIKDSKGREIIL